MAKNLIRKTFSADGTFTPPGGVKQVLVKAYEFSFSPLRGATQGGIGLTVSGEAYMWGQNSSGELGDGTVVYKSSPVLVLGGKKWKSLSFCAGVDENGDAYGWGPNSTGQIGDGTIVPKSSPVLVVGGKKWKSIISCDSGVTMGVDESGAGFAWGQGGNGVLGDGTIVGKSSPVAILGGKKWRALIPAAAQARALGIDSNDDLYAWGNNANGELGLGDVTQRSSPVIVLGGRKWLAVAAGPVHTVGITTAGDLYAWGRGVIGELGDGTIVTKSSPVLVLGGLKWKDVAIGGATTVALTTGGDAYCWGNGGNGSLGDGTSVSKSSPVAVLGGLKFVRVFGGGNGQFTGGMTSAGKIYSWGGTNADGQQGTGDNIPHSSPVAVVGSKTFFAQQNTFKNAVLISVTPGVPISISIFAAILQASNQAIGAVVGSPGFVTLEYYA